MRNPFRRRSVAELTRQYNVVNQRRAAYVRKHDRHGPLDRTERRFQKRLGRILNRRQRAMQRGD